LKKLLEVEREKLAKYKDLITNFDEMSKGGEKVVLIKEVELEQMKKELTMCQEGLDDVSY